MLHDIQGILNAVVRGKEKWVGDDPMFGTFYPIHHAGLLFNGHILVDNANAAFTSYGNRHTGFGNCIHSGTHNRDFQPELAGQAG